ncbi:MAG: phytanoyl-CoA dioxygenase family protein [Candidatus Binatus sp.]|uniref:phytanoyl-CoA dioxygenase family protein n=1 Tax=Candidatus Binatus sp. TaxID=2811406 RepID=UPI00271707B8|nr:phytanoyl-CoA dioxygenase family protein [Candidatus Binatus sp.]MDO8433738.1 phytanoyl-CoA dioxygenase family protein [Candidatus Binatus sp.]
MANLPLIKVPIVDYGRDQAAMERYRREGEERALRLGNRGPLRFDRDGKLDPAILDAYSRCGFYIFERLLREEELEDIERDVAEILARAPVNKQAKVDSQGRPALGADCKAQNISWVRPLSDPFGGTGFANGRHPVKMIEPTPPIGAPEYVLQLVLGSLQFSDACLRLYGHPQLLAVAETINGEDFTPFNEAVWIKQPGLGGSVAWHQDGWTHWDSPDLDEGTHGFNFMAQLYGCNAANGLWVVPGSHRRRKVDIKAMVEAAGSDRLPDAVPLICAPGDVVICNRQAVHGSFANTSEDVRVTLNFGFHRRKSVLGVVSGGVHNPVAVYDEDRIRERSRVIMYAIDARQQRFPNEKPYRYKPFAGLEDRYCWTPEVKPGLRDYNLLDLGI